VHVEPMGNRLTVQRKPDGPGTPFTMADVPTEQSNYIIVAENLTKVYATGRIQVAAVRGVSLAVKPGEFVAIVGPSGSGKSTLFYLLGGLTRASEGRVVIDGVDFASLNDAERTRLRKHLHSFLSVRRTHAGHRRARGD